MRDAVGMDLGEDPFHFELCGFSSSPYVAYSNTLLPTPRVLNRIGFSMVFLQLCIAPESAPGALTEREFPK